MNTLIAILSAVSLAELAGLITTIALLRANRRKAMEEAHYKHAEVRKAEIENDERMTNIILGTIVDPLRKEIDGLREEKQSLRDEMVTLQGLMETLRKEVAALKRAVQRANNCQHKEGCPVLAEIQRGQE